MNARTKPAITVLRSEVNIIAMSYLPVDTILTNIVHAPGFKGN
jgi:hypothetical protein